MLTLFDTIYNDDNYEDIRPRYLGACAQLSCFAVENPKIVENVVAKINSYLYEPDKQTQGLVVLQTVVNQCPSEIFAKNTITWLTLITRILQKDGSAEKKRMALIVAKRILQYLTSFPDLRKQIAEMSQTLILSVLKSTKELEKESMDCLAECMKLLPGPCGVIKSQIEQHIWSLLIELHHGIKEEVCTCFALLPTCGASGIRNATHILNWQNQMSRILSTLHIILNHVFEGIEVDGPNCSSIQTSYNLPDVSDNPYSAQFKYSHYFDALSLCMVKMLSTEYCFKVKIPIEEILSFVYRVLSVNNRVILSRPSTKMSALGAVLPSFYCAAITVLRSLILSCQKLLLPYCDGILKSLVRTLQQTSDGSSSFGSNKPYSFLRSIIYDALSILLYRISTVSILEQHTGPIVEQILLDIKPERVLTKLQQSSAKGSKGKHRKRSSLHSATTGAVSFAKDLAANQMTCKQALKSMKSLLHSAGNILKPNIYKDLHATVTNLMLEVQQNPLSSPVPYNKHCCRLELYSVLLACILNPPLDQLLPIHTAISMFSIGQNDPHIKVAEFCSTALSVCSSMVHPQVSVIQRPYFAPRPENTTGYGISPMAVKTAPNYFDQSNLAGHNEENGRTVLNYLSQDRTLRANAEVNMQDAAMPSVVIPDKPDDVCYKEIQQNDNSSELNGFSVLPTVGSPCRDSENRDSAVFIDAPCTPRLSRSSDKVVDVACVPQLPNNSENIVDVTCSPPLQNSCEEIIDEPCAPQLPNSCDKIIGAPVALQSSSHDKFSDVPCAAHMSSSCDEIIDIRYTQQLSGCEDKVTEVTSTSQLPSSHDKIINIPQAEQLSNSHVKLTEVSSTQLPNSCDKIIDVPYTELSSSHDKRTDVSLSQLPSSCDKTVDIPHTQQLSSTQDKPIEVTCTAQLPSGCDRIIDIPHTEQLSSSHDKFKEVTCMSQLPHSGERIINIPDTQQLTSSHDSLSEVTCTSQLPSGGDDVVDITCMTQLSTTHSELKDSLQPSNTSEETADVLYVSQLSSSCGKVEDLASVPQLPTSSDIVDVTSAEQLSDNCEKVTDSSSTSSQLPSSSVKQTDDVSYISHLPNSCDKTSEENVLPDVSCTKEINPHVEMDCEEEQCQGNEPPVSRKRRLSEDETERHDAVKKKPVENVIELPTSCDNTIDITAAEQRSNDYEEVTEPSSASQLPSICTKGTDDTSYVPHLSNSCDKAHEENVLPTVNCAEEVNIPVEVDCVEECSQVDDSPVGRKHNLSEDEMEKHDAMKSISEEELGVEEMLQDLVPASPDKEEIL